MIKTKEKRTKLEMAKKKMQTFNMHKHDFLAQYKAESFGREI
jgi:hypothetical protein